MNGKAYIVIAGVIVSLGVIFAQEHDHAFIAGSPGENRSAGGAA